MRESCARKGKARRVEHALVKAAAAVHVRAVGDHVQRLRVVALCHAHGLVDTICLARVCAACRGWELGRVLIACAVVRARAQNAQPMLPSKNPPYVLTPPTEVGRREALSRFVGWGTLPPAGARVRWFFEPLWS